VKELDLNIKHFIQNSLFVEKMRKWRQEIRVIELCMEHWNTGHLETKRMLL